MTLRWKIYQGRPYQDPQGFYLTPRRTFLDDPLLYRNGKPRAPFHEWMAWQWLVWACVYEGGGRDIYRDGMTTHLARGQCLYSLEFLMVAWGWKTKSRVSRFLAAITAEGRIRLDWPTVRVVDKSATSPVGSTGPVNPKRVKLPKRESYKQRRVQRLGRLITVLNYDVYQSLDFYFATNVGEVAIPSRYDLATNKKEVKKRKSRSPARASRTRAVIHTVDKPVEKLATPITWDTIRGAVKLGVWPNLPAHIQQGQITEALSYDSSVPEDLSFLINGHHRPDVDRASQLRQVRARLKGEQ